MSRKTLIKNCLSTYLRSLVYLSTMSSSWASAAICGVSMQDLNSGSYIASDQSTESVGAININCDSSASYTIALSDDTETFLETTPLSGTKKLSYKILLDAVRTIIWRDDDTATVASEPSTTLSHILYQRIPSRKNESPGRYRPSITVIISF
jgi:spore coat protein U-like protein